MTTLCLYHCCNSPRHTFNQILTHLWLYLLPFHLHPLPQLQYPYRCPLILPQLPLQVIPQVFNGIEVRGLCRPWYNLESMVFKPSGGLLGLVFGVIVLLEGDGGGIFSIEGKTFLEFILQDLGVKLPIHPPINLACISHPLPQHTAPHHQRPTPKLNSLLHQPITQALPSLLPSPPPPI